MKLNVKKEKGALFQKSSSRATGFDVSAWKFCETVKKNGKREIIHLDIKKATLMPLHRIIVDTGVSAEWSGILEEFCETERIVIDTQLRGRSGLSSDGILCQYGTIDEDYRNRIYACLINLSGEEIEIELGDRIGQLVITAAYNPEINFVNDINTKTERGINGHGSSGK